MNSMSKTSEQMTDLAIRTALTARNSIMDLGTQMAGLANHVGRRRESGRLRSVLWLAGGAVVAGGLVLLFASPGRELRRRIGKLFSGAQDKLDAAGRDGHAEDNMANEGGGSKPRSAEHLVDGAH
jgi:hypothetical protein